MQLETLQQQHEALTSQLEEVKSSHAQLTAQHEDLITNNRRTGFQRTQSDEQFVQELQAKANDVEVLQKHERDLQIELDLIRTERDALRNNVNLQTQQLEEYQATSEAHAEFFLKFAVQSEAISVSSTRLSDTLHKCEQHGEARVAVLSNKLNKREQTVKHLQDQAEEMVAEFRHKEDELEQEIKRLRQTLVAEENRSKENDVLQQEMVQNLVSKQAAASQALEVTLQKAHQERTRLEALLSQASASLTQVERENARLNALDKDRSVTMRKAQLEGDAVSCELEAVQLMVRKLSLALSMEERMIKDVWEKNKTLVAEVEALSKVEAECESFQREWQKEEAERIRLQLKCNQLELKVQHQDSEIGRQEDSEKGRHRALEDVESELQSAQLELKQQAAVLTARQKEGDLLHSALDRAESAAEKHKKESETLRKEVRECRKQLDAAMIEQEETRRRSEESSMSLESELQAQKRVQEMKEQLSKTQLVTQLEHDAEIEKHLQVEEELRREIAQYVATQKETQSRLEHQEQKLQACETQSLDSEGVRSALAREQEKNASLQQQLDSVQDELRGWCASNGTEAQATETSQACRACEERAAGDLSMELQQSMCAPGQESADVEALRREIEETDEALRSAEARIMQLETQVQEEREQFEARISKLALQSQNHGLVSEHHATGPLPSHPQTAAGQRHNGNGSVMETVAEDDGEWQDASLSRDENITLLTDLLRQKESEAQARHEESDRQVERLQMRLGDKDSAIRALEVQLSRSYQELNTLQTDARAQAQEITLLKANQAAATQQINGVAVATPANLSLAAERDAADVLSRLFTLCSSLVQISSVDPLVLNPDPNPAAGGKSKTTVGLVLRNTSVEDSVMGGPAYSCQRIHRGDVLTSINGQAVKEGDSVGKLITGGDLVGSCVRLSFKKLTGATFQVDLTRIPHERVGARRKVFELLQSLRQSAVAARYA